MKQQTVEILGMMRQINGMRDQVLAPAQLYAALGSVHGGSRPNFNRPEEEKEQDRSTPSGSNALPNTLERSIYGTLPRRGPYQQVIRALDLPAPKGFRDPVQMGIVSMQEMSAAWQM
jgi:hypothetical protein